LYPYFLTFFEGCIASGDF
jgi:hypothetical protein